MMLSDQSLLLFFFSRDENATEMGWGRGESCSFSREMPRSSKVETRQRIEFSWRKLQTQWNLRACGNSSIGGKCELIYCWIFLRLYDDLETLKEEICRLKTSALIDFCVLLEKLKDMLKVLFKIWSSRKFLQHLFSAILRHWREDNV